ncbi:MAG: hypothetical protein V2I36_14205 [Desulfopila sp.]|nr:hypothetical protein [Desulfopila sp.]
MTIVDTMEQQNTIAETELSGQTGEIVSTFFIKRVMKLVQLDLPQDTRTFERAIEIWAR